jgi:hypothetical protein
MSFFLSYTTLKKSHQKIYVLQEAFVSKPSGSQLHYSLILSSHIFRSVRLLSPSSPILLVIQIQRFEICEMFDGDTLT